MQFPKGVFNLPNQLSDLFLKTEECSAMKQKYEFTG